MTTTRQRAPRLIAGSGAVLLCVVVWYLTIAPTAIGGPLSLVIVRGTSMEPTYVAGDLVVGYHSTAPRPGEVVIFRGPGDAPVIHRLRAVEGDRLVTQGDNLPAADPWDTRTSDVLGTARSRLRGAGKLILGLARPEVLGAFAAVLVASLVLQWSDRDRTAASDGARRGQPRSLPRSPLAWAAVAVASGAGAVVVGAAAALAVSSDQLTGIHVEGPFTTYVDNPSGGGPGAGGGNGGGGGGGNGPP